MVFRVFIYIPYLNSYMLCMKSTTNYLNYKLKLFSSSYKYSFTSLFNKSRL